MFKKGQVWRTPKGSLVRIVTFLENRDLVYVKAINGTVRGRHGWCKASTKAKVCQLIGNNYQEKPGANAKRVLTETVPRDQAIGKETHNLIQNLRRDNKELRRQNKDLRDDIGDMASKLHLANKRTLEIMTPHAKEFPGTAFKRWLSDMTGDLPEQRGCRKEDC